MYWGANFDAMKCLDDGIAKPFIVLRVTKPTGPIGDVRPHALWLRADAHYALASKIRLYNQDA